MFRMMPREGTVSCNSNDFNTKAGASSNCAKSIKWTPFCRTEAGCQRRWRVFTHWASIKSQTAKANDHIAVELRDVPTTKGLQESIHEFEALDVHVGLKRKLEENVPEPLSDVPYSEEVEAHLPAIAGGLSLALARTFTIIDPQTKHPATKEWERAFQIFDLLL
jgi:hypothetical protein